MSSLLTQPVDSEARDSTRQVAGSYPTYGDAQRAIDRLSNADFPVQYASIVGRDLRLVERVTGRVTDVRAAAGAGTGAWIGLLIGLLIALFTPGPAWLGLMLGGALLGAGAGALFAFLTHRSAPGGHDFASTQTLTATSYDVTVPEEYADHARELLSPLS
ncbi:MAG TPA: general stress protein [Solirubrobacteraceae bacterium]|nr:general stress protein [Solirubrobacteraceae bacterium]